MLVNDRMKQDLPSDMAPIMYTVYADDTSCWVLPPIWQGWGGWTSINTDLPVDLYSLACPFRDDSLIYL